jgi:F420-dependent oxidoreductase-like protein
LSERLKLSAFILAAGKASSAAKRAQAYEQAGVEYLGVAEAYDKDAVAMLGFLAGQTEHAQLLSQILPIYSRTPTLTAMTAAGIDFVSEGRFNLGLGASGPQVIEGWHGVAYDAPVGRTREVVEICRQVWRREVVSYEGSHYQLPLPAGSGTGLGKALKLISEPYRDSIPVFIASLGDKNVELTAEIAEGWLPHLFFPERADRVWAAPLAAGAAKRAADLPPLQVVAGGPMAIGEDVEPLRERGRPAIALYVGGMGARGKNFYNNVVSKYGFEREAALIQDLYLDGQRKEAAAAIPDELLEGLSLIGDEAYLKDRLAAFKAAGVTILQVDPVGADPVADIRRLRELIEEV